MRENRTLNNAYAEIGSMLIQEREELKHIRDSQATIAYLSSNIQKKQRNKVIYGECEKVPGKFKWGVPADFTITLFEPNIADFTDEQIEILIFHELLHVGIEKKDDNENYYIVPHDLEDFRVIINEHGTDWVRV